MTKLTNALNRLLTAGAAVAMAAGLAMPAQAMTSGELEALLQETAAIQARAFSPAFSAQAAFADPASIESALQSLEFSLSFPAANVASGDQGDYNSQVLYSEAYTTLDTMLLRACTIAEDAVPPGPRAYNFEEMAQRINAISNALRLVAPMYIPTRTDMRGDVYGAIADANAASFDIMAILGEYVTLDTEREMSSQYYDYILTVIWENARDACEIYAY